MNKKVIITGIVIHLICALFSAGYYHVDEHFQILEFTSLKLEMAQEDDLPWEYYSQLRPTLQPALAYIIISVFKSISLNNPFIHAVILRLISAILSLLCMYTLIFAFDSELRTDFLKRWFLFLSLFIWFLPYLHVRFSSENWSGFIFWIGFALVYSRDMKLLALERFHLRELLDGMILGFSFVVRFQVGLLIAGLILWLFFIKKERPLKLFAVITGISISILIGLLIDYWFYGEWTFTAWNYFQVNIIESKAAEFGVQPWWFYLIEIFLKGFPPYSILIIISVLFIWIYYPRNVLTWITIPYLIIHFLIGHKELRFLFPLANIIPILLVLSIQVVKEDSKFNKVKDLIKASEKYFVRIFLILNSILLFVVCIKPADMHIYLYQYIYSNYNHEQTELLYIKKNPFYARAVPVNFYKKNNLKMINFENAQMLANYIRLADKTALFVTDKFDLDPEMKAIKCSNVFQTLPRAATYVNINNWLERTPKWILYECTDIKGK